MLNQTSGLSRRRLLKSTACGFGSLALAGMCAEDADAAGSSSEIANPLAARQPMFVPRAKRVIVIFMQGGPSQVDTFDYKPVLEERHGEVRHFDDARKAAKIGMTGDETVM